MIRAHSLHWNLVRRAECNENVAAGIVSVATNTRQATCGALCQALELNGAQWSIRGKDDDDAAVLFILGGIIFGLGFRCLLILQCLRSKNPSYGDTGDFQRRHPAVIGLYQCRNGIALLVTIAIEAWHHTARSAGASLETLAHHACTATGVALWNCIRGGCLDAINDMLRRYSKLGKIVEMAIKGFAHDGQEEPIYTSIGAAVLLNGMLIDASIAVAYSKAVCKDNGAVEESRLFDPVAARQLPRAVVAEDACMARVVEPVFAWENGSHSGVDSSVSAVDGFRMDEHARNVGDAVLGSRWPGADLNAGNEIAKPNTAGCRA